MTANGRGFDHEQRDLAAIAALEEAYDRAWSAGDLDALLSCIAPEAVVVNPRGQVAEGREEFRDALATFWAGEARDSQHRSVLERISLVGEDVAVVDGRAEISMPASGQVLRHGFTDVVNRVSGRWLILHIRAYA